MAFAPTGVICHCCRSAWTSLVIFVIARAKAMPPSGPTSLTKALREERSEREREVASVRMREVVERGAAKRKNADCERDALEVDAAGRVLKKVAHRLRLVRNELAPSPVDRFQRRDLGERGPELLGE